MCGVDTRNRGPGTSGGRFCLERNPRNCENSGQVIAFRIPMDREQGLISSKFSFFVASASQGLGV